jgi:ABC-type multidrug transport system fused ATPase/permease subunit
MVYFLIHRMQLRIGCIASIYHKSLKLSAAGIGKSSTAGEMSNLASNDVERFLYASLFISYLFWAPIEAISVLCVGIYQLGPAFAAGYVVLFTFVPLQFYLGHRFAISRSRVTSFTDERVNLVSQAVTGARVMKMSCWELEFVKRINDLRKDEIKVIRTASRYRALNEAIFFATSVSVAIVIFIVHVLSGNVLTPHNVFTTFALINIVQFTMTKFFAYAVMSCSECYVSVRRIQNFLELPEHTEDSLEVREGFIISVSKVTVYWNSDSNHSEKEVGQSHQRMKPKHFLMAKRNLMNNCRDNEKFPDSFKRQSQSAQDDKVIGRTIALENISFELESGRLYCVIGPVGCGKSALLLALAGELEPTVGSIKRHTESVAYVAQSAWIMDGTLKENILMGNSFDQTRYNEVIDACGLRPDLERFYSGDETLLGDRGIQCSKCFSFECLLFGYSSNFITRWGATCANWACACFISRCRSSLSR